MRQVLTGEPATERQQEGAGKGAAVRTGSSEAERPGRPACRGPAGCSHTAHRCLRPGWLPSMGGRGLPGPRTQRGRRLGAGVLPPPHPQEEGKGNKRSPRGGAAGQRLALTAHLCAHPRPQLQVTELGQGGWPKGSRITVCWWPRWGQRSQFLNRSVRLFLFSLTLETLPLPTKKYLNRLWAGEGSLRRKGSTGEQARLGPGHAEPPPLSAQPRGSWAPRLGAGREGGGCRHPALPPPRNRPSQGDGFTALTRKPRGPMGVPGCGGGRPS